MKLAERLSRLGTETAFAVSGEAAAHVAAGNKVYPFHLGDMNIRTPLNIIEATHQAMLDGKTGYCPNYGIPKLRELLAEDINKSHHTNYTMENVAIQPGGKPSIGKFVLSLMNPGDEALYPNPGYPIYESQIQFHGGVAVPYSYHEGPENFELDLEAIEALITPKTKLLVLNDLQNPMGAESDPEQLEAIAELAIKHDLFVLCDEAYFDIRYEGKSTSLTSFEGMQERSVILYTFSKKYAMTGWRLGASIGPKEVIDSIAKLNVNDESCSNHFIQYGAIEALTGDQSGHEEIVSILKERRDKCVDILNTIPGVRCYRPNATFYLFPNVTELMKAKGLTDYEDFRKAALVDTGVSFCTRKHFGSPIPGETEFYIRFAYSGIDLDQIEEGLGKFKAWAE
jgi:aspartate/methionine/tyrosine aminotransferase